MRTLSPRGFPHLEERPDMLKQYGWLDSNINYDLNRYGFREDEFNIHVVPEGNKLVVQGVQDRGEDTKEYLHKGIGARNFTRTFGLTDDVKVVSADFDVGMLYISLEKIVPEEKKPKEIKVSKGQPQFLQE